MKKASGIVVYERVREVYNFMINASKQRKDIIQFFTKKWTDEDVFNTESEIGKHRTIDTYIRKVKKSYFNFENDVEIEKGRTLARLEDLYAKSIKIQDYKGALQVVKEIKLTIGIDAPAKYDHMSTDRSMSPKELTPEIAKVIADKKEKDI